MCVKQSQGLAHPWPGCGFCGIHTSANIVKRLGVLEYSKLYLPYRSLLLGADGVSVSTSRPACVGFFLTSSGLD